MRLEDLLFLEGWDWEGDVKRLGLRPGEKKTLVDVRNRKGFFFGAVAAFTGGDDARYAYLLVNCDDTFYMPLYPYGLRLLGLDTWIPYGVVLLKYDTVADVYIVAHSPGYMIPYRQKLEITVGYPERVRTWFGEHVNEKAVTAYVAYLYIRIVDEGAFRRSYREVFGR
ncbi:MAG: hypothetical protein DRO39_06630 [Thermoprotei archaeon]|nr:MAG: hypothetical protein DRO39_06630 [Thermoprotei archaeon]